MRFFKLQPLKSLNTPTLLNYNEYIFYIWFISKKKKKSTTNLLTILNLFGLVALNQGKKELRREFMQGEA